MPDATVRKGAAKWLANNSPSLAEAVLRTRIGQENDEHVVKWLALGLARNRNPADHALLERKAESMTAGEPREWVRLAALTVSLSSAEERIASLIHSSDPTALADAARLIWQLPEQAQQFGEPLVRLLDDESEEVRRWALLATSKAGLVETYEHYEDSLRDSAYLVREWGECAIATLQDPGSAEVLIANLADEHPRVREWAVRALCATGFPDVPAILEGYLFSEPDPQCREAVFLGLGPYAEHPVVRRLVLEAIGRETEVVVLFALIDLVVGDPSLRMDHDVVEQLLGACEHADSELLRRYFSASAKHAATEAEQDAMRLVSSSPTLARLYSSPRATMNRPPSEQACVVIALPEEFRVFREHVERIEPVGEEGNHYRFACGTVTGIAVLVGEAAPPKTEREARRAIEAWKPRRLVSVGISGSLDGDAVLGDVVLARTVNDYMHNSKAVPDGTSKFSFELSGDPFRTDDDLLKRALNLEFQDPELFAKWSRLAGEIRASEFEQVESEEQLLSGGLLRNAARVVGGPFACGPSVGAANAFTKFLKGHDRKYLALDMESVAVYRAGSESKVPFVASVRGISDFADVRKNELESETKGAARRLAMANATTFTLAWLHCELARENG